MKPLLTTGILISTLGLTACIGDKDSNNKVDIDNALKDSTQLESYLKRGLIDDNNQRYYFNDDIAEDSAANDGAAQPEAEGSDNFSSTNTQEANVDEADLIKQNGSYLYAYSPGNYQDADTKQGINIYRTETNPVSSTLAGQYELPEQHDNFNGMYLVDDSLVTVTQGGSYAIYYDIAVDAVAEDVATSLPYPENNQPFSASLSFLDLEDPAEPQQDYQLKIEGNIISSRRVGNHLYLVNRFQPLIARTQEDYRDPQHWTRKVLDMPFEQLLPRYWVNGELQGQLFEDSGCYLPELNDQGGYHNIIALVKVDLTDPAQWQAQCSSGRVTDVYASGESLVLAASYWDNNTRLDQFSLEDLTLTASGEIPGFLEWPIPRYRLSEKDGYLRVVVSHQSFDALIEPAIAPAIQQSAVAQSSVVPSWEDAHHRLYILKANDQKTFDQVAVIPNTSRPTVIGKPGEQVKSVRFRGDRAYIVTFRQTDPLYVLNLANPTDPYVEGELEIEGFSQYLHPVTDELLLGLGVDASEFGRTQGLKATLFDVSNPALPTEISSQRFGDSFASAKYLHDPRSVSFLTTGEADNQTTRVAFSWRNHGYQSDRAGHLRIMDINHQTSAMNLITDHVYSGGDSGESYSWGYYSRTPLHADGVHLVIDGEVTSGPVTDFQ